MSIKVYLGKQTSEKVKTEDTNLIDAGATDFGIEETIQELKSERLQDIQAQGDSTISKIEDQGNIPIEFSEKILKQLLAGISYTESEGVYKMSTEEPSFYTIVLADSRTNERWDYVDCKINSLKLNVALGGYITGSIDVVGKTYEISSGTVTGAQEAGDILRALHSKIELDGTDISEDVEGVDLDINNGIEARGSLNSLYNTKFRRATPMATTVSIQKNEYNATQFKQMKTKMIAGTPVKAKIMLGTPSVSDLVTIEIPKMFINANRRGDFKGAGSHSIELQCSINNEEKSHLKFTFKED